MENSSIFNAIKIEIRLPIAGQITEKFRELRFPYTVFIIPRVAVRKILESTIGSIVQVCFNISDSEMFFRLNRFLYENLVVMADCVLILDDFVESGAFNVFDQDALMKYLNRELDERSTLSAKFKNFMDKTNESEPKTDFQLDITSFFAEKRGDDIDANDPYVDLEMIALTTEFFIPEGDSRALMKEIESQMYTFFLKQLRVENPYFYEELAFDLTIILSISFFKIFFSLEKFMEYREHAIALLGFIDENLMIFSTKLEYIVETKALLELTCRQSLYSAVNRFTGNSLSDVYSDNLELIPDYIYPLYNSLIKSIERFLSQANIFGENEQTDIRMDVIAVFLGEVCSEVAEFMNRSYIGDYSEYFNREVSKDHGFLDINGLTGQVIDYLQRNDDYPDIYLAEKNESERIAENAGLYYFVRLYLQREILHSIQESDALPEWLENDKISTSKIQEIAEFL